MGWRFFCAVWGVVFLAGCATLNVDTRRDTARSIATGANLAPFTVAGGPFVLAGYRRITKAGAPASVYIEGDGFAWIDRYTVSPNPTPIDPVALRLAASDRQPNVIYLARPCQYVALEQQKSCGPQYWTNLRFAPEVINSYDAALNQLKKKTGVSGFDLVGFSGGGAIAALLAARRDDVKSLRTVAGNLDHVALNKAHKVSPLTGSLNAIDIASRLDHLPQTHVSGSDDTIVPPWVAEHFLAREQGPNTCRKHIIVDGAGHTHGWLSYWMAQGQLPPRC